MMADSCSPTTGAARKARERRVRANARHVQWLAACYQSLASHHTHPGASAREGGEVVALRGEVEQLKKEIAGLKASLQTALVSQHQQVVQDETTSEKLDTDVHVQGAGHDVADASNKMGAQEVKPLKWDFAQTWPRLAAKETPDMDKHVQDAGTDVVNADDTPVVAHQKIAAGGKPDMDKHEQDAGTDAVNTQNEDSSVNARTAQRASVRSTSTSSSSASSTEFNAVLTAGRSKPVGAARKVADATVNEENAAVEPALDSEIAARCFNFNVHEIQRREAVMRRADALAEERHKRLQWRGR